MEETRNCRADPLIVGLWFDPLALHMLTCPRFEGTFLNPKLHGSPVTIGV